MLPADLLCRFTVHGYCQPKQRTFGRGFITPPETRAYEKLVKQTAGLSMRGQPYTGFVEVIIHINCAIPKSFTKKKRAAALLQRIFPINADLDNCVKAILDGMNRVIYADDRQVMSISASRQYAQEECVNVSVYKTGAA